MTYNRIDRIVHLRTDGLVSVNNRNEYHHYTRKPFSASYRRLANLSYNRNVRTRVLFNGTILMMVE